MKDPNYRETLPLILAVDFDGTLVADAFPGIGTKIEEVFNTVLKHQKAGAKVILWTCRVNEYLQEALDFCAEHGLHFDAVNRNVDEVIDMFGGDARKIYANIYIDDKALHVDDLHRIDGSIR